MKNIFTPTTVLKNAKYQSYAPQMSAYYGASVIFTTEIANEEARRRRRSRGERFISILNFF